MVGLQRRTTTPVRETWKPVPGYESLYEVSDQGRIRNHATGRILRPGLTSANYLSVSLHRGSRQRSWLVHQLVALAFHGPRPEGMIVCHGPAGRFDNRPCNVSYGTHRSNNVDDKIRDGKVLHGERNPKTKLTDEQVLEVRRRVAAGEPKLRLARQLGVCPRTIRDIVSGKTWEWLNPSSEGLAA